MALVRVIIQDALTEIGAYQTGESVTAADAAVGLQRFQMQIDAWAADELTLFLTPRVAFTIPGGTNTLTIGEDVAADINVVRPTFIQGINYINPGSSPEVEVPMGRMDYDQYMAQSIKELESTLPQQFFFNNGVPLGELFFWPTPTADVDCALYYPHGVGIPATLFTDVLGPAGYQEAFMYQLALRLCRPFGKPITPDLLEMANSAYARMKRPNTQPGLLGVDQALVPSGGGAYNVLSDGYTGSSGRG
jgi:hypothetical protein